MNNSSNQEGKKNYVRLSHSAGSNQKMYGSGETDVTSDENGNIKVATPEIDAIKDLSINGRTITYTKRDGTQGILTTQDTDTHHAAQLYVGGSTGGTNAATSNGGTYLKLYENSTVRSAKQIKGTGKTKVSSDSSGNITVDTQVNEIREINTNYIRITDLSTGVYKLTYAGTKYIYYSGTSGMGTINVYGSSGAVILTINRYASSYWTWHYINNNNGSNVYLCYGYTNSSGGNYRNITLPNAQTGTLALNTAATTSAAGLMSATDKTKLNSLYTTKIFKSVFFSTPGGDTDTKYFNINAEFDQSAKIVRLMGSMKCTGGTAQTYRAIAYSTLNNELDCTGISKPTFKYGQWWVDAKRDSTLDITGYGTCFELNNDYFYFARHFQPYLSSLGAWGSGDFYTHCRDGQVFFDITFGYTTVTEATK